MVCVIQSLVLCRASVLSVGMATWVAGETRIIPKQDQDRRLAYHQEDQKSTNTAAFSCLFSGLICSLVRPSKDVGQVGNSLV